MNRKRLLVLVLLLAAVAAFFAFDLKQYVTQEFFESQRARIDAFYAAHPLQTVAAYFIAYVAVTALSLPGAVPMTLVGGALFGFWLGTLLVSFASTIGATLAFLAARLVLRDWVESRFGERLSAVNAGIEKEGAFYLFALRLVPIFPFFLINLLMGLTRIGAMRFYWVSQVGMLLGTMVYVYAGTQLGQFRVSGGLLVAFALIGLLPLAARRTLEALKAQRVYARWKRPASYEYNLVVIGAGAAGLVSAYIGAATRAKVALVERHRMGGDCLNTGCVPSKALLRSAKLLSHIARAKEFGIAEAGAKFEFADVMERVARVVRAIEPHDSVKRYRALGVDCVEGSARITTPWTVEVQTRQGPRTLTTKSIVIAAGARPLVPPIPGLDRVDYLTSDTLWNIRTLPRRLLVLGGGPVGCELAQAFARLGSQVTLVEMAPRLLLREDPEVGEAVLQRFRAEGVDVRLGHTAVRVDGDGARRLACEHAGAEVSIEFDQILVAVGRVANTSGYGLEELGIGTTPQHTVATDESLRTIYPNITACGDVAGPFHFTHTASHQAWYATVNALFGGFRAFEADYRVIPWTTFTDPEVARVGLSETEAKERKIPHAVTVYGIDHLDRAIADGEAHGFVKVLTAPGTDRILGVTIVGEHAGDLIAEYVLAMKHGLGLGKLLGTIHVYPTLTEANKHAAGAWKRSTVTRGQWAALDALQAWRRGAGGFGAVLRAVLAMRRDRRPAYAKTGAAH
jgi:pyruvate/2-oxoglutarate dehydrogenase complex dihydrolipoamide dehydrogenase (E3) component/uncharacterized membrane protein YdjX (TVP38/TMEM64 family)